jgi:hypothetical protein
MNDVAAIHGAVVFGVVKNAARYGCDQSLGALRRFTRH